MMPQHHKYWATRLLESIHPQCGVKVHHIHPTWFHPFRKERYMVSLDVTQKFSVSVVPADPGGAPAQEDQGPTWPVTDDPGAAGPVLTVIPSSDGLSCEFRGANTGTTTIIPTSVADGKPITGVPIQVMVAPKPTVFATQLLETIGPVVPQ